MKNKRIKGFIFWEACLGFTIACLGVILLGLTLKQNRQTEKQIEKRVESPMLNIFLNIVIRKHY